MSNHRRRDTPGPWRHRYNPYQRYDNTYDPEYYASSSSQSSGYYAGWNEHQERYYDHQHRGDYYGYSDFSDDRFSYAAYERQDIHNPGERHESYRHTQRPHFSERPQDRSTSMKQDYSRDKEVSYPHERDDRPVTPPPPRSPSPTYIRLAEEPPENLPVATEQRKLLILDLNGTLVHRAPVPRTKSKPTPPALDKSGRPLPRLRPTHPRPYMPSFRTYLFARETKAWLDVMIWSSAQPHSVQDMVEKCFGSEKERLLAVWARDTLGLSAEHYNRKVQTVKDLNIPWSKLPSLAVSSDVHHPTSTRQVVLESSQPLTSPIAHSAHTTLLLDDSPRKAELQPYNHFCLPEYSGTLRAKDIQVLMNEKLQAKSILEGLPAAVHTSGSHANQQPPARKTYDETLLAVIGVLEEIKTQRNVAAWMRAGGLWGPQGQPGRSIDEDAAFASESALLPSSSTAVSPSRESAVSEDSTVADADIGVDEDRVHKPSETSESVGDRQARRKERKQRRLLAKRQNAAIEASQTEKSPPAGNDALSSTNPGKTMRSDGSATEAANQLMWFEHLPTMQYWVSRGKKALEELKIPVDHGI